MRGDGFSFSNRWNFLFFVFFGVASVCRGDAGLEGWMDEQALTSLGGGVVRKAGPALDGNSAEVRQKLTALLMGAAPVSVSGLVLSEPECLAMVGEREAWVLRGADGRSGVRYTLGARRRASGWDTVFFAAEGLAPVADADFDGSLGRVLAVVLRGRTKGKEISGVRGELTGSGTVMSTWGSREVVSPWESFRVFMVDDAPEANWGHACRYVFAAGDLSMVAVAYEVTPLSVFSALKRSGGTENLMETIVPFERTVQPMPERKGGGADGAKAIRYDGPVSNCYAVIISGGYNQANNHIRYWGDAAYVYSTLTRKYGYVKTNVYALISDGLDPAADRSDDTNSPWDLDGDGTNDTQASATAVNVSNVFVHLQSVLTSNDQFFVFTTDHGGPITGGDEGDVELNLWNTESLTDVEMKALTEGLPCPVHFVFEQCYSGGFVDDLAQSNRTVATAAWYNESSYAGNTFPWFDQWCYYWTAAMRGFYPQTNEPWVDALPCDGDLNGDGYVSMDEAQRFAYLNKYSLDHPMWQEIPEGLGKRSFLLRLDSGDVGVGELVLDSAPSGVVVGAPFSFRMQACNVFGDVITNYAGPVNIHAEAQPIDPGFYVGTGTVDSAFPMYSDYMDARTQIIYPPRLLGGARTLDEIQVELLQSPPIMLSNWTIRAKHTALTEYPSNAVWESEGWTTVYVSNQTFSSTGWVTFAFNVPFAYNGTDSLMLDFSFFNAEYDESGSCCASVGSNYVAIAAYSDNEYGDPLLWSNDVPTPTRATEFLNLRFGPPPVPVEVEVSPTQLVGLVDGVWTGSVTLLDAASSVRLVLEDATNAAWRGHSDWFTAAGCGDLGDAMHVTGLVWVSGGDASWFAQNDTVRGTGLCAAQAGAVSNNQASWVETIVTGPGLLTFYWKVSSEEEFDYLSLDVNGTETNAVSGEMDWGLVQAELASGVSTVRWTYAKDGSVSEGDDTGWVTDVALYAYTGRVLTASGDLAFGKVGIGTNAERVMTLRAPGDEAVTVWDITGPAGFSVEPTALLIPPGASSNVT
ncbi:MAG: C13 family peptidase, partial [Kiritimatiellae bacterium]|nr:C13 family peptidase [Kiritimatiellia bacterium]